jgi:hypothetical protein
METENASCYPYIIDVVSITLFKTGGRKAHPGNSLGNESDIQVVFFIL